MPVYIKGTTTELIGTLEAMTGTALVNGIDADGQPEYEGTTQVDWNGQRSVLAADGSMTWVDENGGTNSGIEVEELPCELENGLLLLPRNERANIAFSGQWMVIDSETERRLRRDPGYSFDDASKVEDGGYCVVGDAPAELIQDSLAWSAGRDSGPEL